MAYDDLKQAARQLKAMHPEGTDVVAAVHPDNEPDANELRQAMDEVGARVIADSSIERGMVAVSTADSIGEEPE